MVLLKFICKKREDIKFMGNKIKLSQSSVFNVLGTLLLIGVILNTVYPLFKFIFQSITAFQKYSFYARVQVFCYRECYKLRLVSDQSFVDQNN